MTDPGDWSRLDALLDQALSRPPRERRAFLDEACGGDPATRARLEELLGIAEREDPDLRPGGALEGAIAGEVWDEPDDEPPLAPGDRLGRFEITGLLGRGGVGRVYRAKDPALGREIAIKALSGALRTDPQALGRFEREARTLATVNHPNVAAIHGLETIDGQPYLLLELVPGETLEERLRRGRLSWRDAAAVAVQMAEALEETHRRGVVHRDFKPGNVKLTPDGRVKVLDFGLARAVPVAGREAPHGAATATVPGTVLGTAPYMSPEQARGAPADARTDVWALGCVLYEMVSGRPAFAGRTVADVLTAVMRDPPDWSAVPTEVPDAFRRLTEKCLRRDVRRRLQDVGDARIELMDLLASPPAPGPAPPAPASRRLGLLPWLIAGAALGLALVVSLRRPPASPPSRFLVVTLELPAGHRLDEDYAACFALSPDASTLAFLAVGEDQVRRLFVRPLDRLESRAVPGSEGAWQPFFSPDGRWVAFFADRKLQKAPVSGGASIPIVEVGNNPRGAAWAPDGTIVLAASQSSGLSRVSAEGGPLADLTRPDAARGERSHRWPHALPDGSAVLFTADQEGGTFDEATIEAVSLRTGERKEVLRGGSHARTLPGGDLVFTRGGRLFATSFDAGRLEASGRPVPVLEGVRYESQNGGTLMALAADGTLLYVPGLPSSEERRLTWLDTSGKRERLDGAPRFFHDARIDPAGGRVAVRVGPPSSGDVFVHDAARATMSQLTFGMRPRRPVWSRDGRRVVVGAPAAAGWQLAAIPLASGRPEVLYASPHRVYPADHSPDGRTLVFQELDPARGWDVRTIELDAAGRPAGPPRDFAATPAHEGNPRVSPDGRWIAYESDELDAVFDVYVAPFRHAGSRHKVSADSGRWPAWGGEGELFYWVALPSGLRRVAWRAEHGSFQVTADRPLPGALTFARSGDAPSPGLIVGLDAGIDYSAANGRLLVLEEAQAEAPAPPYRMTLVLGWADEVARRLAAAAAR